MRLPFFNSRRAVCSGWDLTWMPESRMRMPLRPLLAAALASALAYPAALASELDAEGVPVPAAVTARDNFHDASLIEDLAGRWAGNGMAVYPDGRSEAMRCVALYVRERAPGQMREVIRCKGAEIELRLGGKWTIKDGAISGTWTEDTYSLSGKLSGSSVPTGFDIKATSTFADATVAVRMSGCRQDIVMTFSQQVDQMKLALRKC